MNLEKPYEVKTTTPRGRVVSLETFANERDAWARADELEALGLHTVTFTNRNFM